MKSNSCRSTQGKPLSEYFSEIDALNAADHVNQTYGRQMSAYKCQNCDYWHLSPQAHHTPSVPCHVCTGSDMQAKSTYRNKQEATQRAEIIRKENGRRLKVYKCEYSNGWHLTSYR